MEIGHPLNAWTFSIAGHANSYVLVNDLYGRHRPPKGAGSSLVLAVLQAIHELARRAHGRLVFSRGATIPRQVATPSPATAAGVSSVRVQ
jgi:hypothetical protein